MMRAVMVHGVEIPDSLIAQEAQYHAAPTAGASRVAAALALATKALLLRRAVELGLIAAPERDESGREETEEAALVRAVLDAEVQIEQPTEMECRRVYAAQRARFRAPELYEAAHILIEPASDDAPGWQDALVEAERLLAMLTSGTATFAELAARRSTCPSAGAGGSLGQLQRGDLLPEIEDALLSLSPGRLAAAPVRSRFGWHLLRLERRVAAADLPFEAVSEHIRADLERRAWTAAAARYVVALAEAVEGQGIVATLSDGGLHMGSACLGDLLTDGTAGQRLLPWLAEHDAYMFRLLLEKALDRDTLPAELVRQAVAAFVGHADDEQWTQLVSAARDGEDPAFAALVAVLKSTLPKAGGHWCGVDAHRTN